MSESRTTLRLITLLFLLAGVLLLRKPVFGQAPADQLADQLIEPVTVSSTSN
jgi:hypothetical protein